MEDILLKGKSVFAGINDRAEWEEGTAIFCDGVNTWISRNTPNTAIAFGLKHKLVIPDTVCLFTGLPDKENKRIFEADIFKTDDGHIGVVTFGAYKQDGAEHYGFYIKWNDEQLRKDILYWIDKGCVVGNVHDNPELLEGVT